MVQTRATFLSKYYNLENLPNKLQIVGDHPIAMEIGSGLLSTLPYEKDEDIIQTQINPHFEQGKFDLGLVTGTQAIIQILENKSKRSIPILQIVMLIFGAVVWFFLAKALWKSFK